MMVNGVPLLSKTKTDTVIWIPFLIIEYKMKTGVERKISVDAYFFHEATLENRGLLTKPVPKDITVVETSYGSKVLEPKLRDPRTVLNDFITIYNSYSEEAIRLKGEFMRSKGGAKSRLKSLLFPGYHKVNEDLVRRWGRVSAALVFFKHLFGPPCSKDDVMSVFSKGFYWRPQGLVLENELVVLDLSDKKGKVDKIYSELFREDEGMRRSLENIIGRPLP